MALAKRITLFVLVNILVLGVISFLLYMFNIQPFLLKHGMDYKTLAIFCLVWGMGGALISLSLSRIMAKWMMGVKLIDANTQDSNLRTVQAMVYRLAQKAGLPAMPEVGYYRSPEVNAFATGPTKSRALVAVSTGLLQRLDSDEVEAVLGHEVTHIANGDMVTMTLLQGIINAFVMFMARILAFALSKFFARGQDDESLGVSPLAYQLMVFAFEIVFMFLGMLVIAHFSRYREYRADAGGARLAGTNKMIQALEALKRSFQVVDPSTDKPAIQTLKISGHNTGFARFFATHPPLDERIARLRARADRTAA